MTAVRSYDSGNAGQQRNNVEVIYYIHDPMED